MRLAVVQQRAADSLKHFCRKRRPATMASRKPICSYGPACYRRNVDHFRQMAHPHLEDLLDSIPKDKPIDLPSNLKFACTSRALLKEQLEAVRTARQTISNSSETPRANFQSKDRPEANCTAGQAKFGGGETSVGNAQPKDDQKVQMRQMSHTKALAMLRSCGEAPDYVPQLGKFAEKHRNAAPYYIFFTAVQKAKPTWSQQHSVTLSELLDKSLGKITSSLHLNFVVDIGWLCTQYLLAEQKADMVVFYGEQAEECPLPDSIKMHKITCPNKFGCHHSKLSILQYEDGGIRVIVSTANLYKDDWHLRTQGIWMSPHLPRLPTSASASDGESKTRFKQELISYLSQYGGEMDRWKAIVKRTDCSAVNVALVFSVPGRYSTNPSDNQWGRTKLATLLKKHVAIPEDEPTTTIIAQASSMGNFGKDYNGWIGSELVDSMSKTTSRDGEVNFKVIFPTLENYKNSYDMREGANCLCYTERGHTNQLWLERHLHHWVANRIGCSRAVPHIKTFTRISSDESKIWWFVLGSSNLSKAAWGYRQGAKICVLNYETCVVFLPKFVTGTTSFAVKPNAENATPIFPIPYDLPLKPYGRSDKPFVTEFFQKGDNVFSS